MKKKSERLAIFVEYEEKSSFCLFVATLATTVLSFSCSTTRVLGDGQFRLADNKVVVDNDRKFNTKEIQSYIKQKPNSYIIFGWNPFLNIYNWSGKNPDKAINSPDPKYRDRACGLSAVSGGSLHREHQQAS